MDTRVLILVRGRNPPGGVHDVARWWLPLFKYCSHWSSLRQDKGLPSRKNVRRSEASSFWAASLKLTSNLISRPWFKIKESFLHQLHVVVTFFYLSNKY